MISAIQKERPTSETIQPNNFKSLYTISGIAAFLQLITILGYTIILGVLGPKPTSAEEFFALQQSSRLAVILRGDLLMLILMALYLGTFPALYVALRRVNPVYTALATLFTIIAIAGTFATDATFALLHLGDLYAAATSVTARAQYLAAGEAVIAADMWHSSAAYMGGILLQGAGVMISLVMRRSQNFSKITAYSGLLCNGFDLIQHVLHLFFPAVSAFILVTMGIFYFVWFPMLGLDLLRLRNSNLR